MVGSLSKIEALDGRLSGDDNGADSAVGDAFESTSRPLGFDDDETFGEGSVDALLREIEGFSDGDGLTTAPAPKAASLKRPSFNISREKAPEQTSEPTPEPGQQPTVSEAVARARALAEGLPKPKAATKTAEVPQKPKRPTLRPRAPQPSKVEAEPAAPPPPKKAKKTPPPRRKPAAPEKAEVAKPKAGPRPRIKPAEAKPAPEAEKPKAAPKPQRVATAKNVQPLVKEAPKPPRQSKPETSAKQASKSEKPPKRLPPRLRKKMEAERAKAEGRPLPPPPEKKTRPPRKAAARDADARAAQRSGELPSPPALPRAPAGLRKRKNHFAPMPSAQASAQASAPAQRAPAAMPTPPPGVEGENAFGAPSPSQLADSLPPLPPPPPGGDGPPEDAQPAPVPPSEPPAHADKELAALKEATDISNCLMPLLRALNWRGDPRHIAEALPHFTNQLDVTSFRNILATLHFQSRPVNLKLSNVDHRLYPCLFLPEKGDAMVLLEPRNDGVRVFDGGQGDERIVPYSKQRGVVYFFNAVDTDELQAAQSKIGWFRAVGERFRGLVYQTFGITLVLNILALVTPLFVMAVYDKVVATGSLPTLGLFALGVSVAIICDLFLRTIRSKIMAHIGARLDNIVGIAIFHKILFLPPAFTERATIGAQVARIKDFETVRDFFTGPLALVLFEVPFVFIFMATIFALAGPVVIISIIMIACYALLGLVIAPLIRNSVSKAARASSKKQELLVETLGGMRAVKYCGAESRWMERFREFSATSALNSFYTAQFSALMQTISHVLMISAGLGTIVFGVFRALNGDMSVGGLVASMILVWRVLAPIQTVFISLTRMTQVKSSITQINNLMNIRGEREQHAIVNPIKRMEGFVTFARVSIRYSPDADPALVGVSMDLEPGEVLCVVGGNGSGKSTVLKLLAGMYQPQAGSIRIDNQDIRQMDIVELRHAVSYVPQSLQFFYGTIAQNLRMAHPTASEEDLYWACTKAGVLEEVLALEQGSGKWKRSGFEVRIGDAGSGQMPTSLLQKLNLARGYLKRAPIMLFDEPGNGLDFEGDQKFMEAVNELRGGTTCMIVHPPAQVT